MAFTSLEDARNKVTNPELDENSVILYANNGALDSSTIFYTNQALTTLAPAGNYVVPSSQFKSYYVTLGSDGKIVGTKQTLLLSNTDTSWVDDSIMQYIQGFQIPSDNFGNFDGGTSISITNNQITDAYWSTRPYPHAKKWQIDYGVIYDTAMTNIDLSDMKGYDLKITTGEWYGNTWPNGDFIPGFTNRNFTNPIVHIAADYNRVVSVGNLNYYFRPDYFFPKPEVEYESSFRRLPNNLPIYDKNGVKKQYLTVHNPLLDAVVKNSGQFNTTTRTFRNSTRGLKGETLLNPLYLKNFVEGNPSNPGYYMRKESNGANSNNILQVVPYSDRHIFNADAWIRGASAFARGIPYTSVTQSDTDVSWVCGLLLSLTVEPIERDTWTFNVIGVGTKTYAQINPYQWTTIPFEGSENAVAPATQFLGFFNPNGTSVNPNNESHAAQVQFDFEYVAGSGRNSFSVGDVYRILWENCQAYSIANNWPSQGGLFPGLSNYAEGMYNTGLYGNPGMGWDDVLDRTVPQAKATLLFDDYKNYYLNGTKSYNDVEYNAFYQGAILVYDLFFVSNYVIQNQPYFYFYAFVHNYDISKKLISNFISGYPDLIAKKRVMGYCWNFQEPNYSDFYFARIGVQNGEMQTYRPNTAPSFNQSLAVWSMAYADGLYLWDNTPPTIGGEYTHENFDQETSLVYFWGLLTTLNNGLFDWFHIGIWQVMQNRDIVSANTNWEKPQLYWNGSWTSNTDANSTNIPVMLAQAKAPISAYKLSDDGTQALLIITYPYNNGYTKSTHTIRLPTVAGVPEYTVDTWGQYTSVIRINLT